MDFKNNTPYAPAFDDIYFSPNDGIAETQHVFLNGNNIKARFQSLIPREIFIIAETGFGTGLNFLITAEEFLQNAPADSELIYYSVEKFPLSVTDINTTLQKWRTHFEIPFDTLLKQYPIRVGGWHKLSITPQITLILIFDDAVHAFENLPHTIDAFYLDGFAPAKNPDIWSDDLFKAMAKVAHSKTTCASFTAAGDVRRGLTKAGFTIEKTKGYGRKRDMIIGRFQSHETVKTFKKSSQSIAILGAGLAGAMLANTLKKDGHNITIFETKKIAFGASGNDIGLYNPRFTSERSAVGEFYSTAYAAAYKFFAALTDIDFKPTGAFHLITDDDKNKRFTACLTSWQWHKDHAEILPAEDIKDITGIDQTHKALYLKQSGSVSPLKLCETLLAGHKIMYNAMPELNEFDVVIYAGGALGKDHLAIASLPLQSIRGQITFAKTKNISLNNIFCYGGYTAPMDNNKIIIGSTFQPWLTDSISIAQDNIENVEKATITLPSLKDDLTITGDRASFRAASPDRFPMVGKIPHQANHFISSAHGSHGLISTHLSAEIIRDEIIARPQSVGTHILYALDPIRFENRQKKK